MKVFLQVLKRIPRTLRYADMGKKAVLCEFVSNCPDNRFILVKLLENGAGYKIGHVLMAGKSQITEA